MCFRPAGVEGADTTRIKCPQCGEMNMNTRKTCFSCGAELPKAAGGAAFPDAFGAPGAPAPGAPAAPGAPGAPGAPAFPDAFGKPAAPSASSAPVFPDAFGKPNQ